MTVPGGRAVPAGIPGANPPLVHPGPVAARRRDIVPTAATVFDFTIAAGETVETGIRDGFARAGFVSGCIWIEGLVCDPLRYFIPAEPDDPSRLAWYSETHTAAGRSVITRAYMSVGRDGAGFFSHCHGLWRLADGSERLGHLLPGETVVAAPFRVHATGFHDAFFDRRPDAETGFSLLSAVPAGQPVAPPPGAVVVTLHPNEDIGIAIEEICTGQGIGSASILGLGSMNGAEFRDGSRMDAAITEFLVCSGRYEAGTGARIEIAAVDKDARLYAGIIRRGRATVSITAELVIVPD